jgi:hypothetical protein
VNAERLHAIALAIREDLATTSALPTLGQLRDALQSQVNSPAEPSYQVQVATSLDTLLSALASAPSNTFSPTWIQVVEELGVAHLLGERLAAGIREIFERNQITPSVAAAEVGVLTGEVEAMSTRLDQLVAALDHFHVGAEELGVGEAEVGVLIPRAAVGSELQRLGSEFEVLQKLLGPFLELATGSRPPIQVSTISSSDFGVFLDVAPRAAALLAVAVERVVALYKNLLEVRELRQKMADQGVPAANLAGVDEHANSVMAEGIDQVSAEVIARAVNSLSESRLNELGIEVHWSLNGIANRIDAGFNIDVRDGKPIEDEDENNPSSSSEALRIIHAASPNLRFINRTGKPILSLPEGVSEQGVPDTYESTQDTGDEP